MPSLDALDAQIIRWEKKLWLCGGTDRAEYILHMINLLRRRRERLVADGEPE